MQQLARLGLEFQRFLVVHDIPPCERDVAEKNTRRPGPESGAGVGYLPTA
jgi:hypothetical protein